VLLAADEAPAEQVATHLLAGAPGGEAWAVEALRTAAARALAGGAPRSAVRYLERALAEPPPPDVRAEALAELGRAAALAGDARAVERLEAAMAAVDEPLRRAEILLSTGRALHARGRHGEAAETFDRGLREAGERDAELALRLQAGYIGAARMDMVALPLALARVRPVLGRRLAGDTPGERALLAHVAHERALAGAPRHEVERLARAALRDGVLLEEETADGIAFYAAVLALAWTDALDDAAGALDAAIADARRRGSVLGYATACATRARLHLYAGRVGDALADAQSALDGARDGWELALPAAHAALARALLERGDLDAAGEALELPGGDARWEQAVALGECCEARGWLALARADPAGALECFEECRRRQSWTHAPNPAVMPWRAGAALAHAALGDPDQARPLAAQELRLAREFGAPRAVGAALRVAGLVEGGERGLALLAEAVRALDGSPARLELARARCELGAALRRAGRRPAAQDELRRALDLAHSCGATALADRARDELATAGGRPRRPRLTGLESLTASERRTAELAAEGLTNREIAQALFVTVKTVEWHLRNTYVKLGIGSRRELGPVLAAAEGDAARDGEAAAGGEALQARP
jgi:DNA-binding CsgD family transcriptional regulator